MSTLALKAPTLTRVHHLLSPLGYRKAAALFSRAVEDVIHLIEVQGSRSSTNQEVLFTVNVGVFVPALIYPDVRDVTRPSIPDAHWRERLGFLCPEQKDLWWKVSSAHEALDAAEDVAARNQRFALPALAGIGNTNALATVWRTGQSAGLTEFARKKYLLMLDQNAPP